MCENELGVYKKYLVSTYNLFGGKNGFGKSKALITVSIIQGYLLIALASFIFSMSETSIPSVDNFYYALPIGFGIVAINKFKMDSVDLDDVRLSKAYIFLSCVGGSTLMSLLAVVMFYASYRISRG